MGRRADGQPKSGGPVGLAGRWARISDLERRHDHDDSDGDCDHDEHADRPGCESSISFLGSIISCSLARSPNPIDWLARSLAAIDIRAPAIHLASPRAAESAPSAASRAPSPLQRPLGCLSVAEVAISAQLSSSASDFRLLDQSGPISCEQIRSPKIQAASLQ